MRFFKKKLFDRGATRASTEWLDTTMQVTRVSRETKAIRRWAIMGALVGAILGVVIFAPASWLAWGIGKATQQRIQLFDAQGTIWKGNAWMVLSAGPGSLDARLLPDRLSWDMGLKDISTFQLSLQQACCINQKLVVLVQPGWGRVETRFVGPSDWLTQWPADVLSGLGTPWNTLDLNGSIRLSANGLTLEWVQGRLNIKGSAALELQNISSRISTLERLGTYRVTLTGQPQQPGSADISLSTQDGALLLNGQGTLRPQGVYFRGEATARDAEKDALDNLLNVIGRRNGESSVISIG